MPRLPTESGVSSHLEPYFVHELGRLQDGIGALPAQRRTGQAAQLAINGGDHRFQGGLVACAPPDKQIADSGWHKALSDLRSGDWDWSPHSTRRDHSHAYLIT